MALLSVPFDPLCCFPNPIVNHCRKGLLIHRHYLHRRLQIVLRNNAVQRCVAKYVPSIAGHHPVFCDMVVGVSMEVMFKAMTSTTFGATLNYFGVTFSTIFSISLNAWRGI